MGCGFMELHMLFVLERENCARISCSGKLCQRMGETMRRAYESAAVMGSLPTAPESDVTTFVGSDLCCVYILVAWRVS